MGKWLTRSGQIEPCVYQPGQPSRYKVMIPTDRLTPTEVDELHGAGARRSGWLFYKLNCPTCQLCQPLRLAAADFVMSRSQRRVWKRNQDLDIRLGRPQSCPTRVALYNKHLFGRGLNTTDEEITVEQYERWLVQSGLETLEFAYFEHGELLGLGLLDVGENDASSVYFYFDPACSKRSLGTYSILKQIEWVRQHNKRFLYLGFHNDQCPALRYKAGFSPHAVLTSDDGALKWSDTG